MFRTSAYCIACNNCCGKWSRSDWTRLEEGERIVIPIPCVNYSLSWLLLQIPHRQLEKKKKTTWKRGGIDPYLGPFVLEVSRGGIIASSISNELPDTLPSPFSDKPAKNQPRFRVTRIKRNFITDTARAQLLQLPCRRYAYEVFIPWFRSRSNSISIAIHRSLSPAFFALIEITDERRNVEM